MAQNRLILICAPAGYGKTTLVGDWIRRLQASGGPAAAWLSLDEGDNDPAVFFSYFFACLQKIIPGTGEEARSLLESPQRPPIPALLSGIVNDLAASGAEIILVLDDYHAIHSQPVHEGLSYLIEHLPPGVHLAITSRSDPPFPLHRFRGRGQMVEIRQQDLRFSREEVNRFLSGFSSERLGSEEIGILEERTEGWITGIQMAALSMRGRVDKSAFIRSLAGSNRYILDYLAEEVMKGQSEAVQHFLLQTSLLDRLCGPLCDAMVDPALHLTSGQEMLEELERSNLFLIPLDDERRWYRYHHLFADLLRVRLKQAALLRPGMILELHRRAAGWLRAEGWAVEAIQHLINGEDYENAAVLVEQNTLRLFAQGELHLLLQWIHLLPPELSAQRPWLAIYQAWALAFAGQVQGIEPLLHQAEQAMVFKAHAAEDERRLQGEMIAIRGMAALMSGNVKGALPLLTLPVDAIPEESLFARSAAQWVIGYLSRMRGNLPRAVLAFQEMLALGRRMNNIWTIVSASIDLGEVLRQSGRLQSAGETYREALQALERSGSRNPGFLGRLQSFLATNLLERGEVDEARRLALEAVEHNRRWENPNHITYAALVIARIALSTGDITAAGAALETAGRASEQMAVMPHLVVATGAMRARLYLAQGDLSRALQWAANQPEPPDCFDEESMGRTVMVARVRLAQGDRLGALDLLARLETDARGGSKNNLLIETLTLTALAETDRSRAYQALEEAIALGLPEGYRRVYLDEGEPLRILLQGYRAQLKKDETEGQYPDHIALVDLLLSCFPSYSQVEKRGEVLLTDREIEILRCMAEGLTNEEIGRKLYISAGTVKAHSAAIYRKLDVANRSEAISKAKDKNII